MGGCGSRWRVRWRSLLGLAAGLVLLLPLLLGPVAPAVRARHTGIMLPFAAGAEWFVSQGYNTSPDEGWSHYNCNPKTGKDDISRSTRCDDGWQYKYSFDLRRVDGEEAGQPVLSPATGVVRWIDPAYGGLSLDLGDGYAVAFFHVDLARGIEVGDELRAGQRVGNVSPPGGGGNGGTPHIHLTVWQTEDGGNWSRIAVPFAGDHLLEGQDFPALADRERNQYLNAVVASSNVPVAPTAAPGPPALVAPADGARIGRGDRGVFVWEPVLDAAEYQVVIDDGARTGPWLARTRWDPGDLPRGTYRWQVRARNDAGESPLSEVRIFIVAAPDAAAAPAATPAATPIAVVESAQAVGSTTLNLAAARATVGTRLTTNGTGFAPGEAVRLFWDSASGPLIAEATANDLGAFTISAPIPAAPTGHHPIVAAGQTSGATSEGSVEVIPSIAADPPVAPPGAEVEVTLRGFGAEEPLDLSWRRDRDEVWGSGETNSRGSLTLTVAAPEEAAGLYDLLGVGQATGATALGSLRLEGEDDREPALIGVGRMVGSDTFAVTATVLGLIGGMTSSGEIIDAEDRLVALPACTTTSCPWLEPGVPDDLFGTRIECGDRCFVRVANPATDRCAVAPVLETGPWFTLDDWWNPTADRALNRLPTATSQLAQGYPGAEAAQDGVDAGYGRSPDGIGISNKGYVVGNRAAMDLSNQTWQDIGLDLAIGIAEIEASPLWLSGEDPALAAEMCANPQSAATPEATPAAATPTARKAEKSRRASSDRPDPRSAADEPRVVPIRRAMPDTSDGASPGAEVSQRTATTRPSGKRDLGQRGDPPAVRMAAETTGADSAATEPAIRRASEVAAPDVARQGGAPQSARRAAPTEKIPSESAAKETIRQADGALRGYRSATSLGSDEAQLIPAAPAPTESGFTAGPAPTGAADTAAPGNDRPLSPEVASTLSRVGVAFPSRDRGAVPDNVSAAPNLEHVIPTRPAAPVTEADGATDEASDSPDVDPTPAEPSARERDRKPTKKPTTEPPIAPPAVDPTAAGESDDTVVVDLPTPTSGRRSSEDTAGAADDPPKRDAAAAPADRRPDDQGSERGQSDDRDRNGDRRNNDERGGTNRPDAGRDKPDRPATSEAEPPSPTAEPAPEAVASEPDPGAAADPDPNAAALTNEPDPTDPIAATETELPAPSAEVPAVGAEPTASGDPGDSSVPSAAPDPDVAPEASEAVPPTVAPESEDPTVSPANPDPDTASESKNPAPSPEPPVEETPPVSPAPTEATAAETRVFLPVADTTVWTTDPARVQEPMQVTVLPVGGPDDAVAYLTFQVEGVAPGSVVAARLVVVGSIGFGGPLSVGALPGYWVDEAGLTAGMVLAGELPATGMDGLPSSSAPIWVGTEAVFDVSGTVAAAGTITFVVHGTPDAGQGLGSRESALPARLEVTASWQP